MSSHKRPVRSATATIAQMEDLIVDLVKIKEQRESISHRPKDSACSSICSTDDVHLPHINPSPSSSTNLYRVEPISGRDSTSSGGSDREQASVALGGEIEDLREKVRFQQVLIDGLKTKQVLVEEKARRLATKTQSLALRVEEQQEEIRQLRAALAHERVHRERLVKEEAAARRGATTKVKPDKRDSGMGDASDMSDGSTIIVRHDDDAKATAARSSGEVVAEPERTTTSERGRSRAKERLKSCISAQPMIGGEAKKKRRLEKKIASAREDFERKEVMLKRVVERLNAERVVDNYCAAAASGETRLTVLQEEAKEEIDGSSEIKRAFMERRSQIINEFVTTEEAYVNSLRTIVEVYLTPLREALLNGAEILSAEEMETLFSRDITTMFTLHATLLIELQGSAAFTPALSSFVPYLKIYTQYVNNFPQATELLTQKTARSRRFAEFIKERQEVPASLSRQDSHPELGKTNETLSSLLVMDILNCTPQDSAQAQELHNLLQAVQEVNTHVNESKRKEENTQKLLLIQKGLIGNGDLSIFDRIGRRFVMEGRMGVRLVHGKGGSSAFPSKWRKVKAADKQPPLSFSRHLLFLFNDLLMETKHIRKREFKFKRVFFLDAISIDSYDGNEEDAQRIFVLTDEEDGRVLHLKADSVQEKLEWMQAIAKQIDTRQEEHDGKQQQRTTTF
ncbi:RhoGEF domain containing protein [Acanthamoeba castellanii str. Neff]|uniref:RhoGEF domain containing protein n=1 Tax=Acanthamoeba castellanii (strain ATCC 30010 / Neff) TaxID=1257118 RepID=L8H5K3_ACACF|nr:RhoGEF domain containing protein [Acanthamoeba castellanii str. Neff]ELR20794.1 RhoGEF domain containing protein [Acanthamoeba castellanii str. Neff]